MKNVFAQGGGPKMVQVVKTTGTWTCDRKSAVQPPKSIKMEAGPPLSAPDCKPMIRGAMTALGGPVALKKEEKSTSEALTKKLQGGGHNQGNAANAPLKACSPHSQCERIDVSSAAGPSDGKASVVKAPREVAIFPISAGRFRRVPHGLARRHCVHRANRGWWLR